MVDKVARKTGEGGKGSYRLPSMQKCRLIHDIMMRKAGPTCGKMKMILATSRASLSFESPVSNYFPLARRLDRVFLCLSDACVGRVNCFFYKKRLRPERALLMRGRSAQLRYDTAEDVLTFSVDDVASSPPMKLRMLVLGLDTCSLCVYLALARWEQLLFFVIIIFS